jgi:hypothetical protein
MTTPNTQPEQEMIEVRIACVVDEHGNYCAGGWKHPSDYIHQANFDGLADCLIGTTREVFITARIPKPTIPEIAAENVEVADG